MSTYEERRFVEAIEYWKKRALKAESELKDRNKKNKPML